MEAAAAAHAAAAPPSNANAHMLVQPCDAIAAALSRIGRNFVIWPGIITPSSTSNCCCPQKVRKKSQKATGKMRLSSALCSARATAPQTKELNKKTPAAESWAPSAISLAAGPQSSTRMVCEQRLLTVKASASTTGFNEYDPDPCRIEQTKSPAYLCTSHLSQET